MKGHVASLAALVLLAGCGGGGGGSSVPGTPATTQATSVNGSVVLSIPTTAPTGTSAKVRYPQFVSPNASSVTLSVNGGTPTAFDVSATSSLCTTGSGSRNCTLAFAAPPGSDTFAFVIYAGAGASGATLASATATQTVVGGQAFNFSVALNAAIGTIVTALSTAISGTCPNAPATFVGIVEGCASSGALSVTVSDPSGAQVTGTAPYAAPIAVTSGDPALAVSPAQITSPGQTISLTYTGAAFASGISNSVMVNLSGGGQGAGSTLAVRRSYLYVANANSTYGGTVTGGGNVAVYAFGASGTATPVRLISGTNTQLQTPVYTLLDSSGNLYVLDNGSAGITPIVNIYSAGANGNVAPARQITGINAVDSNLACETMIFNPSGTSVFVTCTDNGTGQIHVLTIPNSGSVTATAAQTVSIYYDGWSSPVIGQAFDKTGTNLYVADSGFNYIFEFLVSSLPTSGTYQDAVPAKHINGASAWAAGTTPIALVIDGAGSLYATISYLNSTAGAQDAGNEVGIWKASSIPCNNCAPDAAFKGTPFSTHASAGLALDPFGNLYVSNSFNNTISVVARSTIAAASGTVSNPAIAQTITTTAAGATAPTGMVVGP